jgi:hypothetical protein
MKSGSQRVAELRARLRKEGLKPLEVWAYPEDHSKVKKYVERLRKRRSVNQSEQRK